MLIKLVQGLAFVVFNRKFIYHNWWEQKMLWLMILGRLAGYILLIARLVDFSIFIFALIELIVAWLRNVRAGLTGHKPL
ncbi:hypothetical protein [Oenococcus sicerae]|uniref:Uncharacterized protein n=1 Tax=Oenococcus sicerae TaxID=2203724 RepID=A0AAJ1VPR8_9LACO|nr:hypothetical protein [Oenococcus sicerae]MDN6901074.1 hypothetical protein [Oenococcus sicerae]